VVLQQLPVQPLPQLQPQFQVQPQPYLQDHAIAVIGMFGFRTEVTVAMLWLAVKAVHTAQTATTIVKTIGDVRTETLLQ
jgi:hypothetical protein